MKEDASQRQGMTTLGDMERSHQHKMIQDRLAGIKRKILVTGIPI